MPEVLPLSHPQQQCIRQCLERGAGSAEARWPHLCGAAGFLQVREHVQQVSIVVHLSRIDAMTLSDIMY